jgi:hypothetical protein
MIEFRARLAAGGLVLLAVWEIMVLASAHRSAPSRENWQAVAAVIPPMLRDDQLIVFAPRWIDPVGRLWLGSRMSLDHAARMDAVRYREIWEVSVRGAEAPDVAGEPAVSEQAFGPIRLRRFVRDAPRVTWSLSEGARICEVDFEPRRGVVLELDHPLGQARRPYEDVNLGDQLQVYAGLADYKKRSDNRATALIQVMVDGREATRGIATNDNGWAALPTAATPPGLHEVEILARVQDPRDPIGLSVCVAAEARTKHP